MIRARYIVLFGCLAALFARAGAEERNLWPVRVAQQDVAGHVISWESAGPLIFKKPGPDNDTVSGVRPFFVRNEDVNGLTTVATVLYPLFIYRADSDTYQWTFFNLINKGGPKHGVPVYRADQTEAFDLWIFWFSRQTGSPETSYRALFPIAGTIKSRFGFDQLSWVIWPLYLRSESKGAVTTSTPWPFIRTTQGAEQGFALWPLFGWRNRPERFHKTFYLWPLGWNNTLQPPEDAAPGTSPLRQVGAIPFYTRDQRDGYINENYVWPFFGYTDRTRPNRYHETRYLWPFLVQGRGDDRWVNRWAPFYTHSVIKGMDKTWIMWPLLRRATWTEAGVEQTKTQFVYAFYWSLEQRSLTNPKAAPADRTHLWPLYSKWDNGAGRRQFQLFSPFDVFFPNNEHVRETWTPLFAIYRSDQRAPDDRRWSALWRAVTWRQEYGEKEFHLGPLLSISTRPDQRRVAVGNGLFGWKRDPGDKSWHAFWFDFPSKPRTLSPETR
jgi:hypothetical protein